MQVHTAYTLLFLALVAIRSYFAGLSDATGERLERKQEGTFYYFRFLVGIPYYFLLIAYAVSEHSIDFATISLPEWLRWVGIILFGVGIAGVAWVHLILGKNFTDTVIVRKKGSLVKTGPYYYVRHPMYLMFLLLCIGASLAAQNWLMGLSGLLLTLLIMILRTPIEEKRLEVRFGQEWINYKKRTPKFFI